MSTNFSNYVSEVKAKKNKTGQNILSESLKAKYKQIEAVRYDTAEL